VPFNSNIERTGAAALMPEEVTREIIQGVPQSSAVMSLARRLPNMSRKQTRMPVLDSLPLAYFVDGDTGLKQTTTMAWDNKYLDAEEVAVIVPIPEAVLDDTDYDIWGEVRPRVSEAIGKVFDAAVFFGTNAPTAWPDDLKTAAVAAGNSADLSTIVAAGGDLYDAIMGEDGSIAKIEADGFMATGHVAPTAMRSKLRGLRDANGVPIFTRSMQEGNRYELDGDPMLFPLNGIQDSTNVLMFSGDWTQLVWAVRQEITYKILTESVIQDGSGNIIYNLAQQDMVALRAVIRLAWQVPNPINSEEETEANRFPFSILVP
jgi:HK97 family phage major capsid protein